MGPNRAGLHSNKKSSLKVIDESKAQVLSYCLRGATLKTCVLQDMP